MPPITKSYEGVDKALSLTPQNGPFITLLASGTADSYWFVVGTLAFSRPAGSTPIYVEALFKYTGLLPGTTPASIEFGASRGRTMSLGVATADSIWIMKVVKVPMPKTMLLLTLQGIAGVAGVSMVGESSQGGQKVTTLVAFPVK